MSMKKLFALVCVLALSVFMVSGASAEGPSKTVSVVFAENITTLDPQDAVSTAAILVNTMVFDSLITSDHEGNYFPSLAESWEVSEDELTYTFHIRQGVTATNGEEVNAHDVAFSYQRLLDNPNLVAAASSWTVLDSIELVDDYTVNITLNQPYGPALYNFSGTYIIPDEAYAEMGDAMFIDQKLVGSGAWEFVEWVDGQYVRFKKNPNFWDKANYDPYYEEAYLRFISEPSSAISAQLSGQVNAYMLVPSDMLLMYTGAPNVDIVDVASGTLLYLQFQCREESVFSDPNVRKAFSMAIDRETIAAALMGGSQVPTGIATNVSMGYDPDFTSENYAYNPEKAQELLANSKYNGEEVKILATTAVTNSQQLMLAICDNVNAIGFNCKSEITEVATLGDVRARGDYDMFIVAGINPGGDLFHFTSFRILNDMHKSNYVNEELNAKIDEALHSTDQAHRDDLYREINKIVCDEVAPMITLVQLVSHVAVDKGVTGVVLYPDGVLDMSRVDYQP